MIWVGAMVQSIILTIVFVGLCLVSAWYQSDGDKTPETVLKLIIGGGIAATLSWIVFGWLVAYGR